MRQRFLLLFLALLVYLFSFGHTFAQSGIVAPPVQEGESEVGVTLSLDEYRDLLREIEGYLLRVPRPDAIVPWMYGKLDQVAAVEMAPEKTVEPVNLLRNVTTAEVALARIQAAQMQFDLAANDRLDERQAVVAAVMSQRIYKENFSLVDWILEQVERFWNWLFPPERDPFASSQSDEAVRDLWRFGVRIIAVVGAVVIALLLGWWLSRLIGGVVRDFELQRRRAAGEELPATAAEARANAAVEAHAGSYRQAVRSLYLSALLSLEEGEIVVHDRSLTNRELLARASGLAAGDTIRSAMQPVVQGFDDVWYGEVEPDATTYATYDRDVATLNKRIEEYVRQQKSEKSPANGASMQGAAS